VHKQIRAKKEADERAQAHREKVERRKRRLEQEKEKRRQKRAERQARAMGTLPSKRSAAAAARRRAGERRQSQIDAQQDAGNRMSTDDVSSGTHGDHTDMSARFKSPLAAGPLIHIATESGVLDRLAVGELLTTKQPEAAAHAPGEGGYYYLYAFVRAHSTGGALAAVLAHVGRRRAEAPETASAKPDRAKSPAVEIAAALDRNQAPEVAVVKDGPDINDTPARARKGGGAHGNSDDISDEAAYNEPCDEDEVKDVRALAVYMRDYVRLDTVSKLESKQLKPEQRRHYARLLVRMGHRNGE